MTIRTAGRPPIGPKVKASVAEEVRDAIKRLAQAHETTPSAYIRDILIAHPEIQAEVERSKRMPITTL